MKRIASAVRPNWEKTVESQGFHFHTAEGGPYWNESAYYSFTSNEVDQLEAATYELDKLCLQAVQYVIDTPHRLVDFNIPENCIDMLTAAGKRMKSPSTGDSIWHTMDTARLNFWNTTPTRRQDCWKQRLFSGIG